MTIQLPPELETSILAAVHNGRYASLDDAMTEAARLLIRQMTKEEPRTTTPPLPRRRFAMTPSGLTAM